MDSSAFKGIGDGLAWVFLILLGIFAVFVPLGVWKAITLICWAVKHLQVTWNP